MATNNASKESHTEAAQTDAAKALVYAAKAKEEAAKAEYHSLMADQKQAGAKNSSLAPLGQTEHTPHQQKTADASHTSDSHRDSAVNVTDSTSHGQMHQSHEHHDDKKHAAHHEHDKKHDRHDGDDKKHDSDNKNSSAGERKEHLETNASKTTTPLQAGERRNYGGDADAGGVPAHAAPEVGKKGDVKPQDDQQKADTEPGRGAEAEKSKHKSAGGASGSSSKHGDESSQEEGLKGKLNEVKEHVGHAIEKVGQKIAQPMGDDSKSEHKKSDDSKSEHKKSDSDKSEHKKSDDSKSEHKKSESDKSEHKKSDSHSTEHKTTAAAGNTEFKKFNTAALEPATANPTLTTVMPITVTTTTSRVAATRDTPAAGSPY